MARSAAYPETASERAGEAYAATKRIEEKLDALAVTTSAICELLLEGERGPVSRIGEKMDEIIRLLRSVEGVDTDRRRERVRNV